MIQNTEGDEDYEYCPICMTDMHLEAVKEGPVYARNGLTGEILDTVTGEPHPSMNKAIPEQRHIVWLETRAEWKERRSKAEDEWLEKYRELCKTMTPAQASAQCPSRKVERRWKWNDE